MATRLPVPSGVSKAVSVPVFLLVLGIAIVALLACIVEDPSHVGPNVLLPGYLFVYLPLVLIFGSKVCGRGFHVSSVEKLYNQKEYVSCVWNRRSDHTYGVWYAGKWVDVDCLSPVAFYLRSGTNKILLVDITKEKPRILKKIDLRK